MGRGDAKCSLLPMSNSNRQPNHKKVLEKRLAKIEAGKGKFLTLTQLKRRLAKAKN
jgi:hypothetical protein